MKEDNNYNLDKLRQMWNETKVRAIIEEKEREYKQKKQDKSIAVGRMILAINVSLILTMTLTFFINNQFVDSISISLNRLTFIGFAIFIVIVSFIFLVVKSIISLIIGLFNPHNSEKELSIFELETKKRANEEKITIREAEEKIIEEEKFREKRRKELEDLEKKKEIESDFLKTLYSLRETSNFYKIFIAIFVFISFFCILLIILLAQKCYKEIIFDNREIYYLIVEGFFRNVRFLIYESLLITLLGYCLKKISGYISMIEIYKELEILLIMDVQRQNRTAGEDEKNIVSKEFQNKFSLMINKHYDSFISKRSEIKLKSILKIADYFKENKK